MDCRDYFFFAQQDPPSEQAVAALCAQPLMPTARIAVMMTMIFFMGVFGVWCGGATPPSPPMQRSQCFGRVLSTQGEKVYFQVMNDEPSDMRRLPPLNGYEKKRATVQMARF